MATRRPDAVETAEVGPPGGVAPGVVLAGPPPQATARSAAADEQRRAGGWAGQSIVRAAEC